MVRASLVSQARALFALTKPRVVALIVFTAVIGMFLATPGMVPPRILIAGTLGIALVAGAAAAINCLLERRIDALMRRTHRRPLPRGEVTATQTLVFAVAIGGLGLWVLLAFVNALTMWLTAATFIGYAIIYTVLLKPATPQNIVIGGAAGALPPMIGWAAATGTVSLAPFVLFLIIFVWTPPHFWALALLRTRDYERAGVPMLPVVKGEDATRLQILIYSIILAPLGMVPAIIGLGGTLYAAAASVLGALFVVLALACYREREGEKAARAAKDLFAYSVLCLFLLFAVLLVEQGFNIPVGALPHIWTS